MTQKPTPKQRIGLWLAGWFLIILLGIDFYNWEKTPRLVAGLPDWVWFDLGLILATSLIYGVLSRVAWEDE
ncbi:MAG: hypothetical protein KatS3mg045_1072 [Bellilinea sp.]|nr:MAG: hypothetical protein KatS3mg045_1072 [Bellilinea sp.]